MYAFNTKKTILQKYFQIGRPICKSAGQSVIGRLVSQFADWQIGWNISMSDHSVCFKGQVLLSIIHRALCESYPCFGDGFKGLAINLISMRTVLCD